MITDQDAINQLQDDFREAYEIVNFAIRHFAKRGQEKDEETDGYIWIIGLQAALLRHAAELELFLRDKRGIEPDKDHFVKLAAHQYDDALELCPEELIRTEEDQ